MFTSGFSLLLLIVRIVRFQPSIFQKRSRGRPGTTVPIESLINKLQGNAKIGRKKQAKRKQSSYLETSHLTREKQTLFDGPSKHR